MYKRRKGVLCKYKQGTYQTTIQEERVGVGRVFTNRFITVRALMDLIRAVLNHDLALVKELCDNVDFQDDEGLTALMYADDVEILNELCDRGANLEIEDEGGWTALDWYTVYDRIRLATALCQRGAKPDRVIPRSRELRTLFKKQQFKRNVLVLVGHIQTDLLRCVHKWI